MPNARLRGPGLVMLLVCSGYAIAQEAQVTPVKLNIAAQPLGKALNAWASQTGYQILIPASAEQGRTAPSVNGRYTPEGALKILLASSDLRYEFVGTRAVTIREAKSDSSAASAKSFAAPPAGEPTVEGERPLVMAQSRPREEKAAAIPEAGAQRERASGNKDSIDQVVITGTHIRGIENPTSSVSIYDREWIERSGFTSTRQVIQALPQSVGAGQYGATEDGALGPGSSARSNNEAATGVNLRGLGPSATLVLLNGHRLAPSAFGGIVDISRIPIEAIDRVEVLPDGASAIYGADAVAGVVNFMLRKDFDGSQTTLRYGKVTNGGLNERQIGQTLGRTWESSSALLSLNLDQRSELSSQERSFTQTAVSPTDILPRTRDYSLLFHGDVQLSSALQAFGDILTSKKNIKRRFSDTFSSSANDVDADQAALTGGLTYKLAGSWTLEASGTFSRATLDQSFVSTAPPQNYVNGSRAALNRSKLSSADIKADGSLFRTPGGEAKAALGATLRSETFDSLLTYLPLSRSFSRHVYSGFAEAYVPIIGKSNSHPFIDSLDLSFAVRYDHYSDFGGTTNPKFGLMWGPAMPLRLRASYSKSFRPPTAAEEILKYGGLTVFVFPFASPSGSGTVPTYLLSGTNPNLQPEKSRTTSISLDYLPPGLQSAKFSIGYYDTFFRDRIVVPPLVTSALLHPEVYGSLITSFPDSAAADAFLANAMSQGATLNDFFHLGTSGVRYAYSTQQQNAAEVKQRGVDISGEFSFRNGSNVYFARLVGAYLDKIDTAFTDTSVPTDIVNTYGNPLRLRLRTDFTWSRNAWQVTSAINYSNRYSDTSATPTGSIGSMTTFDLNLAYYASGDRDAKGLSASLAAFNVFDRSPPYVNGLGLAGVHYDVGNGDPIGRFISLSATMRW